MDSGFQMSKIRSVIDEHQKGVAFWNPVFRSGCESYAMRFGARISSKGNIERHRG
jgi:hypothetical protein